MAGAIVSIGYEGRGLEGFLAELAASGVEVLVDVRQAARSRKPGFAKSALHAALADAGIEYLHLPQLGNPPEHRDAFHDGRVGQARRGYAERLDDDAYRGLVDLARRRRIAVLCVERDEGRCHRWCLTSRAEAEHPPVEVIRL